MIMIQKGNEVYIVPEDTRDKPYYSVVVSIGRKYIKVKGHYTSSTFDIVTHESISVADWNPRLKLYESREEYSRAMYKQAKLNSLKKEIEKHVENATLEQLEQVLLIFENG